ncbi:hypothetical protein CW304_16685 [Bacillus sp. UFRGS-B20]|nr:hypothetical protein CW304_16685 [Bacillus sp. UFRGS-B20]
MLPPLKCFLETATSAILERLHCFFKLYSCWPMLSDTPSLPERIIEFVVANDFGYTVATACNCNLLPTISDTLFPTDLISY